MAESKDYYKILGVSKDATDDEIDQMMYDTYATMGEDMANALAASDLVIGSAGAISLAEITALGKPSIIIPKAFE